MVALVPMACDDSFSIYECKGADNRESKESWRWNIILVNVKNNDHGHKWKSIIIYEHSTAGHIDSPTLHWEEAPLVDVLYWLNCFLLPIIIHGRGGGKKNNNKNSHATSTIAYQLQLEITWMFEFTTSTGHLAKEEVSQWRCFISLAESLQPPEW